MPRLVTKFKYIKPGKSAGSYAKYIATREGVDKIDDSKRYAPATVNQKKLIANILRDFPDSNIMPEYIDFCNGGTMGQASEFISRAIEDNASDEVSAKTYADYIATRPRAQRFGSHGLFSDDGKEIKLENVSRDLNSHQGNVWTIVISLRREDAERLGFDTGERWRDMLRTQTEMMAKTFKIAPSRLNWYAAFHQESHHPHVHLIVYSDDPKEGFMTPDGVNAFRSSLANDIFAQDLYSIYEKQTEQRDTLRSESKTVVADIVSQINAQSYDNPRIEELLLQLSFRLERTSGKKVYGYLKADVKNIVDAIVDELETDDHIRTLYDLWYEQRENVLRTYTDEMPDRVPLSQNKDFKPIKNAIIQEAMKLSQMRPLVTESKELPELVHPEPAAVEIANAEITDEEILEYDQKVDEPQLDDVSDAVPDEGNTEEIPVTDYEEPDAGTDDSEETEEDDVLTEIRKLRIQAAHGNSFAQYTLGKLYLRGESVAQDAEQALWWLEEASENDNPYAQYLLGKSLLTGDGLPQDIDRAVELLEFATQNKDKYAAYLLAKTYLDERYLPKDSAKALEYLKKAAKLGNSFAEYHLGKMYFYGWDVRQDTEKAIEYIVSAAEHGNEYAAQFAQAIYNSQSDLVRSASWRLVRNIAKLFQDDIGEDQRIKSNMRVERKLLSEIEEKKRALGLKSY